MAHEYSSADYQKLQEELKTEGNEKYRKFNESLIPGAQGTSFGVRLPVLRKAASKILKEDWRGFLGYALKDPVHEMRLLTGFVIAGAPCPFDERLSLLSEFLPLISNWAVCDSVCCSLKSIKKNRKSMLEFLEPYYGSEKEFEVRFAAVVLMDYYINAEYIDFVLEQYARIRRREYYIQMAVAWGLSVCFVYFRDKTLRLLETDRISNDIFQMTVGKIRDSRRIRPEDKELMKKMWKARKEDGIRIS